MFSNNRKDSRTVTSVSTLIGAGTEIHGDIHFSGGLHLDGKVEGAIRAAGPNALLTLSANASVIGEIQAPHVVINGSVKGDVNASERLELAGSARVEGNISYKVLEMSAGAQINGKMLHQAEPQKQLPKPESKSASEEAPLGKVQPQQT